MRKLKKIMAVVSMVCTLSVPVMAKNYDITADYGVASGSGSFVYYDNVTSYNTMKLTVKYFYKDAWGLVKSNQGGSLTNENNERIYATVSPKAGDVFSMSFGTESYGFVNDVQIAQASKANPLAMNE